MTEREKAIDGIRDFGNWMNKHAEEIVQRYSSDQPTYSFHIDIDVYQPVFLAGDEHYNISVSSTGLLKVTELSYDEVEKLVEKAYSVDQE